MICAFKLITNLTKGNKLGSVVQELAASSEPRMGLSSNSLHGHHEGTECCKTSIKTHTSECVCHRRRRSPDSSQGGAGDTEAVCGHVNDPGDKMEVSTDARRLGCVISHFAPSMFLSGGEERRDVDEQLKEVCGLRQASRGQEVFFSAKEEHIRTFE